jgi:hypothetical protein
MHHERLPSKRVYSEQKTNGLKNEEVDDAKRTADEECPLLWRHFDDWNWDAVLHGTRYTIRNSFSLHVTTFLFMSQCQTIHRLHPKDPWGDGHGLHEK